jgi:cyclic pyranopterin phosphate synthase
VSLDSLDPEIFARMSGGLGSVEEVLDGIAHARRAGLAPIKVNAVIQRGMNDATVEGLVEHFRGTDVIVRFIEYMDVGATNGWRMDDVVPAREIVDTISREWALEPAQAQYAGEVAERWRYSDGAGEIGVIASVTQAFCRDCTRARLSTDGKLYTCLFATQGYDLRALLRAGASDDDLARTLAGIWSLRDDHYSELRTAATVKAPKVEMSYIGG